MGLTEVSEQLRPGMEVANRERPAERRVCEVPFKQLIDNYILPITSDLRGSQPNRIPWVPAARRFFESAGRPPVLDPLLGEYGIALHGSTTHGIDDKVSDLDFWLILNESTLERFDALSSSRFIDVEIQGKLGHLNPVTIEEFESAFSPPRFEMINELQSAVALIDPPRAFARCQARARRPMNESVRRAAFFSCYVEMRACHKSADNPMDRYDAWTALSAVVKTVEYGMKCALILDGHPYPYGKWLYVEAHKTSTGQGIISSVDNILGLLGGGRHALLGPERENQISQELRVIRNHLIEKANQTGIDEPWLDRWWHFIDEARCTLETVAW